MPDIFFKSKQKHAASTLIIFPIVLSRVRKNKSHPKSIARIHREYQGIDLLADSDCVVSANRHRNALQAFNIQQTKIPSLISMAHCCIKDGVFIGTAINKFMHDNMTILVHDMAVSRHNIGLNNDTTALRYQRIASRSFSATILPCA